jgi:hypothetical protein
MVMEQLTLRPLLSLLAAFSLITLGCGSARTLQSVAVMPAVANAQSFPNGQVPFNATGTFSKPPSPQKLTNMDINWCIGSSQGACVGNINPGATVDSNGVARCVPGFSGTVTILAGKTRSVMMPDGGSQMGVFGSAQLTCP